MATTQWGRKETVIFPPHSPIYTYGAIFLSLVAAGLFVYLRFSFVLTPLQQFYLPYYLRTGVAGVMHKTDKYQLLAVADEKNHARIVTESDVTAGVTPAADGKHIPLQISAAARAAGLRSLYRGPSIPYQNKLLNTYFQSAVYGGDTLWSIFKMPILFGVLALGLQLPFSIAKDIRRRKEMKYGRRLKGPFLVSPKGFNKAVQGDGIGIKTDDYDKMMRIPLRVEDQHIELMGDTGSGKTSLIMQILRQVQSRGHSAIVYDPACEFVQRFYRPENGDIILNPLDRRCPYWGPAEELRRKAEAKAIAASLYQPTTDKKGEFFVETPQKIFAHLLTFGPSPQELVEWMANPAEIDRRVQGTEMAMMIAKGAQQQRNGVLASLGLIADSLRMLPRRDQAKRTWSATEWAKERQGWIFITSQPSEREALRPLNSLWIDLLVLRLLNAPTENQRPVWFVLDELASLQRLPQLHTAITENRKSKNPLVLGFQGKAQLEVIYGHIAEVMLSQPATKIFLKTTEPKAAEWVDSPSQWTVDCCEPSFDAQRRETGPERHRLVAAPRRYAANRSHAWALNRTKEQVMQHLVQMKITPQARPANDEEGLKFANNLLYPTLKRCQQLQQEGKIVAGGPMSGTIGLALIIETDTLKELDQLLTSLRLWPRMETTVTPLTTFADRAAAVEAALKLLQESKALTPDSQS